MAHSIASRLAFIALAFVALPGNAEQKFEYSIPPEQLELTGAMNIGTLAEVLRTRSVREQYIAAREAWKTHSRLDAADVLKYLVGPSTGDREYREFQREVESATKPDAILRELKTGDYVWATWLAFLRPHKDLVPTLIESLKKQPEHLHATALALGGSGDQRAIEPLVAVLKSDKYQDCGMAAQALGYLGDSKVEPELLKALNTKSVWDQAKICDALGMIGTSAAIESLEKLGNSHNFTGEIRVGAHARLAVVKIGRRLKPRKPEIVPEEPIRPIATLRGGVEYVWSFAFSPDSNSLATASNDAVRMWDVKKEKLKWAMAGHTDQMMRVAFTNGGKSLATAGRGRDDSIRILNVLSGETISTIRSNCDLHALCFSMDGSLIAGARDEKDASVELWSSSTGKFLESIPQGRLPRAFSADGKILAMRGRDDKPTIAFWNIEKKTAVGEIDGDFGTNHTTFSPDGALFFASENWHLRCWDVKTKKLKFKWRSDGDITSVAISPDGRWLAVGEEEDQVRILEVATGKVVRTLNGRGHVAFSPDGKRLATGSTDSSAILLWDVEAFLPKE